MAALSNFLTDVNKTFSLSLWGCNNDGQTVPDLWSLYRFSWNWEIQHVASEPVSNRLVTCCFTLGVSVSKRFIGSERIVPCHWLKVFDVLPRFRSFECVSTVFPSVGQRGERLLYSVSDFFHWRGMVVNYFWSNFI